MAMNYVPLDKAVHKDIKLSTKNDFAFTQNTHLAAASIREFAQLAGAIPMVFIKDEQTGNHHTVCMLGIEKESNLYFAEGRWQAPQVPMNIQRYPFDIRPDNGNLGVFIDDASALITDDGAPLFTAEGEAADLLKNRLEFLDFLANSERLTQEFITKVVELDLLTEIEIRMVTDAGERRAITGMLSIDENKLFNLPDEEILTLHKKGFSGAIYALMMSLSQLNRLVELSNKTDKPIRSLQIVNLAAEAAAQAKALAEKEAADKA